MEIVEIFFLSCDGAVLHFGVLDSSIMVEWKPPSLPNGPLLHYIVYHAVILMDGNPGNEKSQRLPAAQTRFVISGLKPQTLYSTPADSCQQNSAPSRKCPD